jgi:hypothetical protein
MRLVFSESDGLSGLIVDRYLDHLVVQLNSLAMSQRWPLLEPLLVELGSKLFDLVIRGHVRSLFDMATGQREGFLPLELFLEDYTIAGWPWEYLYDSTNQMFICQEFHPISRGIFGFFPGAALTTPRRKVRVLLLLGVRRDDPETTPEEEVKWIREVDAGLATDAVAAEGHASPARVSWKELEPGRYDIVHRPRRRRGAQEVIFVSMDPAAPSPVHRRPGPLDDQRAFDWSFSMRETAKPPVETLPAAVARLLVGHSAVILQFRYPIPTPTFFRP